MTELTIGVIGAIIGVGGFLYGCLKDKRLKEIEERANAPHFVATRIRLDYSSAVIGGGHARYNFIDPPSDLGSELHSADNEEEVPLSCPKNQPVGLSIINDGERIRNFRFKSDGMHFMESEFGDGVYQLSYLWDPNSRGESKEFTIYCETSSGIQVKQTWKHKIGTMEINRTKPKPA